MKKSVIWLAAAVLITIIVVLYGSLIEKVTVTASEIALMDQGWYASFSSPLKEESVELDELYVTNLSGKQLTATLTLSNEGRTVHVKGLDPGTYTLHVKNNAINGKLFTSLDDNEIKFTIHETLESVASAKELEDYFERAKLSRQGNFREAFGLEESESSDMKSSTVSDDSAGNAGGGDHSTTNNQVLGVDEGDMVKTDGNYIYTTFGTGKISVTDIRDPKTIKEIAEIKMEEGYYPFQLFLHEETLIVLGSKDDLRPMKVGAEDSMHIMPMNSMTEVRLYNVSNPAKPTLIREIGAEGYLNGARKTGNMLYFVTNVQPNFWIMESLDGALLRPYVSDSNDDEETTVMDYEDISILPGASEPSYSVITAIDLSSPAESKVVTKGYLGSSEQLYMSKDNLYLTATNYETDTAQTSQGDASKLMIWNPGTGNSDLFKFSLNGTAVTFHSSATLKGTLLNQFSMDEHEGYFRVVTTEGNMWDEKNPSKNHLFILDEKLSVTGSVEGLAKDERIYSARFMGDKAYMVTFRETDPLFVIDVSNPTAPKVLGELKIPGYSNYLHPLDENHLIGFGYETIAEKNPDGGEPFIIRTGMKISLFDVSDFSNPREKDTEIIGGRETYSPIQYDHKALFEHRGKNLYGFPVMIYEEVKRNGKFYDIEYQSSGALVYEITPDYGIVLKGDLLKAKNPGEQYSDYEKEIQRLLYSKDVLYTISMKEINNYSLETFAPIGSIAID